MEGWRAISSGGVRFSQFRYVFIEAKASVGNRLATRRIAVRRQPQLVEQTPDNHPAPNRRPRVLLCRLRDVLFCGSTRRTIRPGNDTLRNCRVEIRLCKACWLSTGGVAITATPPVEFLKLDFQHFTVSDRHSAIGNINRSIIVDENGSRMVKAFEHSLSRTVG